MKLNAETIMSYTNFNQLSKDIIEMAKEFMPNRAIYINFLNDDVQVTMKVSDHKTKVNVMKGETIPVNEALCNQIDYKNRKPLIIKNAKDFKINAKVKNTIKKSNLGSYLGFPIMFKDGTRFGALCIAHHEEQDFNDKDIKFIEILARLFGYYLELEYLVYKDPLTGLENSRFLLHLHEEILLNGGLIIMLDLDNFKMVNDQFGHHVSDLILKEVGEKIKNFSSQFKNSYAIRLGGDEFLIYIKDELDGNNINNYLKNLLDSFRSWDTDIKNLKLTSSIGACLCKPKINKEFTDLYKRVDMLLYKAKNKGKNNFILKIVK